ncbi:hypothetical protein BESB_055440 [Besnoitia besnoiti]|uniref:Transmembrane protein n=1 Tax=Besnoitia besnoiti TaxID=94643 RepID=A0A2A9MJR2_BESBE|nr:hypothetical protein BESB_055440 [Besnoitia besnoiti]PFH35893.1 hypothetical protein BESB_055440 [Besnoitia besnoiti]
MGETCSVRGLRRPRRRTIAAFGAAFLLMAVSTWASAAELHFQSRSERSRGNALHGSRDVVLPADAASADIAAFESRERASGASGPTGYKGAKGSASTDLSLQQQGSGELSDQFASGLEQVALSRVLNLLRPRVQGLKRALSLGAFVALGAGVRSVVRDNIFNLVHFLLLNQPVERLLTIGTEPAYALIALVLTAYYIWFYLRESRMDKDFQKEIEEIEALEKELERELAKSDLTLDEKKSLAMKRIFLRERGVDALVTRLQQHPRGVNLALAASTLFLNLMFRKQLGVRFKLCSFGVSAVGTAALFGLIFAGLELGDRRRISKIQQARKNARKAIEAEFLAQRAKRAAALLELKISGDADVDARRDGVVVAPAAGPAGAPEEPVEEVELVSLQMPSRP